MRKTFLVFIVFLLIGCTLSGCWSRRYVIIRPRQRLIREVARPELPKITQQEIDNTDATGKKLLKATKDLKVYSKMLEAGVKKYNDWAKQQNELNGYNDILKKKDGQ